MATYAIGDIQGCYAALMKLLEKINFHESEDTLWFTGDLVNRGPDSLSVLRFIQSLGSKHITVLGNHDLHLIAVYYGKPLSPYDTLSTVLSAPDREDLIAWLCRQRLFYYEARLNYALVHAGLAKSWDVLTAMRLAREVETVLQSDQRNPFLKEMYGNHPDYWDESLTGFARLRMITNYFTRVRYCYRDGRMEFHVKGPLTDKPAELIPWYQVPGRKTADLKIVFGHWASLKGKTAAANVYALDTGCVWGECLTAMRLEDGKHFQVSCATMPGFTFAQNLCKFGI